MVHAINGALYFNAMDGSSGQELWKHDPSTGTTSRIYDIRPGSSGSSLGSRMSMVEDVASHRIDAIDALEESVPSAFWALDRWCWLKPS
mgnify:CR=1 FL=1